MVYNIFKPQAQAKNVTFNLKLCQHLQPPDAIDANFLNNQSFGEQTARELPKLVGDSRRFKQVMINLVKNALKFTNHGQIKIKISYNDDEKMLIGHVKDTGAGIARQDL